MKLRKTGLPKLHVQQHTQSAEAFWIHRIAYVPFLEAMPPEERLNSNLLELIGHSHD
jgi:hypothetical protein